MRPYTNAYEAPAGGYTYTPQTRWRDRKLDGYGNVTETGTVPGAANDYTVLLDERIVKNGALTVTSGGTVLSVVPWNVAPGADQAAVSYDLPLVKVNSARDAEALEVYYTPGGGVLSSDLFNELQKAIVGLGSGKQAADDDLTALAGLSTTGIIARTGSGTAATRTIEVGADLAITNGDGVAGNPLVEAGSNIPRKNAANSFTAVQTITNAGTSAISALELNLDTYGTAVPQHIHDGFYHYYFGGPGAFPKPVGSQYFHIYAQSSIFRLNTNITWHMMINGGAKAGITSSGFFIGPSGTAISNIISATAALDFGSIAAGATAELSITVTGAASGNAASATPPAGFPAGLNIAAVYVSAANTVTIRLHNTTAGAIDPASATWRATVIQF